MLNCKPTFVVTEFAPIFDAHLVRCIVFSLLCNVCAFLNTFSIVNLHIFALLLLVNSFMEFFLDAAFGTHNPFIPCKIGISFALKRKFGRNDLRILMYSSHKAIILLKKISVNRFTVPEYSKLNMLEI